MSSKLKSEYRPSIWQLIKPYWTSKQSWKGWILLTLQLILMFTITYVAVWANKLDGAVVDAMVERKWDGLWQVILMAMLAGLLSSILFLVSSFLVGESLRYQWRSWLTHYFIEKWTRFHAYYSIERDGSVDNADQRISEDIEKFIESTLTLVIGPIRVTVMAVSFTMVLWSLSGTLEFSMGGYDFAIPGYIVYIVYAYCIGDLLITHYTGRPLIQLFNKRQTVEANFRYLGMQLRENAEQIAFYHGGDREQQRLLSYFEGIKGNWRSRIATTAKMMFARNVYDLPSTYLPTLAALPRYLSGAISLGDVTRIAGAFDRVKQSLAFFPQAYVSFAEWKAVSDRLRNLLAAINKATDEHADAANIATISTEKPEIYSSGLTLTRPNGQHINTTTAIRIQAGEKWLIRGPSGAGKSTLIRAIAGIWPYGQGEISIPQHQELMFLPQRSYIPNGTLKAALCYPNDRSSFTDQACIDVLSQVRLEHLTSQLSQEDRWQQKLSGGEQQRLAFARALLQKPDFLFLDEATSAIDPKTEQVLYTTLLEQLPDSALISVAHRESLEKFHGHIFELDAEQEN
ncbi:ABC transporter ATP-binding protein/permease [Acinetobacter populi]|uniref:ABC transporter n=1 Tax=Acinetobacter populi TaxID=1582270 RepID=A0A1Z9YUJ8_9GAMM|nr:ABC transporter ATP-binding protein/permease [Acinetobacter populi]OUY05888.1 ABC transporter [Acinetobacter populi]